MPSTSIEPSTLTKFATIAASFAVFALSRIITKSELIVTGPKSNKHEYEVIRLISFIGIGYFLAILLVLISYTFLTDCAEKYICVRSSFWVSFFCTAVIFVVLIWIWVVPKFQDIIKTYRETKGKNYFQELSDNSKEERLTKLSRLLE